MSQHRFKCGCGKGKLFRIWVSDDNINNVQCNKCDRMYSTKVMKIETGK